MKADIVLKISDGTMEKLGLGYEDLKRLTRHYLWLRFRIWSLGPYRKGAGYDIIVRRGGLMSTTGWSDSTQRDAGRLMLAGIKPTIGVFRLLIEGKRILGKDVSLRILLFLHEIINQIYPPVDTSPKDW